MKKIAAVLCLCAWIAGCTLASSNPAPYLAPGETAPQGPSDCASRDCAPNEPQQSPSEPLFNIEVEPPAQSGFLAQSILNLTENEITSVHLSSKAYYHGRVIFPSYLQSKDNGSFSSSPKDDIADIPHDIIAIPLTQDSALNNKKIYITEQIPATSDIYEDGKFTLELLAGQTYRIIANPKGANNIAPAFASVTLSNITAVDSIGGVDLELDKNDIVINGQIYYSGSLPLATLQENLEVRIYQESNNAMRLVSSVGKPTLNGRFQIKLSRPLYSENGRPHLILRISPIAGINYLPTIEQDLIIDLQRNTVDIGAIALGNLENPILNKLEFYTDKQEALPHAKLLLETKSGKGTITLTTETDEKGKVELYLQPGSYKLQITPAAFTPYKALKRYVVLNGDQTLSLAMGLRESLEALIVDSAKHPLEGVQFQIENKDTGSKIDAITNHEGRLCLMEPITSNSCPKIYLDSANYQLNLVPAPGTKLTYFTQSIKFSKQNNLEIQVPEPKQLTGFIHDSKGQNPISKAFVRIYQNSPTNPILLGQSITDDNGRFLLFVSTVNR